MKREPHKPVAWASSHAWRKNQLMSTAQYDNCLEKNRVDFDIPLVPRSDLEAALSEAAEWRASAMQYISGCNLLENEIHGLMVAKTELWDALDIAVSLHPDPHLDPDKVQADYVRKAKQVLDAYAEKSTERDDA